MHSNVLAYLLPTLAAVVPSLLFAEPAAAQAACAEFHMVWACGTGGKGFDGGGNALGNALKAKLGSVSVEALDYPAAIPRIQSSAKGAKNMASLLKAKNAACPNTKFILTGYSQGVSVIHQVAIPGAVRAQVAAIGTHGDPFEQSNSFPTCGKERIVNNCHQNDDRCLGKSRAGAVNIIGAGDHFNYFPGADMQKTADAIAKVVGGFKATNCGDALPPRLVFSERENLF